MGSIRGADDDEPCNAIGISFAERQRDHAAIRRPRDRAQRSDAEMVDEAQQQLGLVICRHARKRRAVTRAGRICAGTEIIEAQDPKALGIECESCTHHFMPPAAPRLIGQPDTTRGRDASQRDDHGGARRARKPPRNRH
jgi:hypothetical protein